MIVCPDCQHEKVTGAMCCAERGAPLEGDLIAKAITDEQITKELSRKAPRPEPAATDKGKGMSPGAAPPATKQVEASLASKRWAACSSD